MSSSDRSRPRPGILKVFWPAFLGWGALLGVVLASWQRREGGGCPTLNAIEIAGDFGLLAASIGAIFVTVLVPGARRPIALALNLSILIAVVWANFFMPRYNIVV